MKTSPDPGSRRLPIPRPIRWLSLSALFLLLTLPLSAASSETQAALKVNVSPHSAAYTFAALQLSHYRSSLIGENNPFYIAFDTEALYLQSGYRLNDLFSFGLYGKGHMVDWQNLENIVNPADGKRVTTIEAKAAMAMGGVYARFGFGKYYLRPFAHLASYKLKPLKEINTLQLADGSHWEGGLSGGYHNAWSSMAGFTTGTIAAPRISYRRTLVDYRYDSSGSALSVPRQEMLDAEVQFYHGRNLKGVLLAADLRAGAQSSARSGEAAEIVFAYSVGGPENNYRRLAGFAFSEFRVPAYSLVNLDALIPIAGGLHGWLVLDGAAFDRVAGKDRYHAGTGAGLFWHFGKVSALRTLSAFARADYAITALRDKDGEKWQFFFGVAAIF